MENLHNNRQPIFVVVRITIAKPSVAYLDCPSNWLCPRHFPPVCNGRNTESNNTTFIAFYLKNKTKASPMGVLIPLRAITVHQLAICIPCFFLCVSDGLARLPSDLVEGRRARNTLSADRVVFSADDDDDDVVALLNTRLYLSCGDLASSDGPQHERERGEKGDRNWIYYTIGLLKGDVHWAGNLNRVRGISSFLHLYQTFIFRCFLKDACRIRLCLDGWWRPFRGAQEIHTNMEFLKIDRMSTCLSLPLYSSHCRREWETSQSWN